MKHKEHALALFHTPSCRRSCENKAVTHLYGNSTDNAQLIEFIFSRLVSSTLAAFAPAVTQVLGRTRHLL